MEKKQNEPMEIDLLELAAVLFRKWVFLLLGAVIGAVVAGGVTMMKTPVYQSVAKLYILSSTTSITSMADIQLGNALSPDFVEIAQSRPVLDTAIQTIKKENGITLTRAQIQGMTSVSIKDSTRIMSIAVQNEDPELACDVANALSDATAIQMETITKSDPPTTFEKAEVAQAPLDNGLKKNVEIGIIAGLFFMALFILIPYLINDKICTPDDVEKYLETGVLGAIPDTGGHYKKKSKKKKASK